MATPKLSGALSFAPDSLELGGNTKLRLTLTAAAPLSKLLGQEGSIAFLFRDDNGDSYEHNYLYEVRPGTQELELSPEGANEALPFVDHSQTDRKTVSIDGNAAELVWQFNKWERPGRYRVSGQLVAHRGGDGADFGAVVLKVGVPVMELPAPPAPQPPASAPPVPPASAPPASQPAAPFPLPLPVTLQQADRVASSDQQLWGLIRRRVVSFNRYRNFIDNVLCGHSNPQLGNDARSYVAARQLPFSRSASYAMLKHATEFYLMQEAGLAPVSVLSDADLTTSDADFSGANEIRRTAGEPFSLEKLRTDYLKELEKDVLGVPYFKTIRDKLAEVPLKSADDVLSGGLLSYGILKSRVMGAPLMELIWSYWHEEGGLVQTMNALSLRFQNVRRPGPGPDPLANLAIDPLRPLNNIIWGYIEDERNRLTMNRRNLEYQYEYGFGLIGRGVQNIAVAEHRTFFLRGFHSLLRAATEFYQQANFTTVIPDGFPILNHLREVHLTLAEGAHNQYGDLPWTARTEMLTQQYILARPEVREFLGGRIMVPYAEPWMDRVDNMKSLQGWNPTNITHFRDLGAFGEQLLLSIRYGAWNSSTAGATSAANWAHYWREEIQRYIHAYKAVTGIDLATDLGDIRQNLPENEERYLQPAQLIERQNAIQQGQLRRNRQLNPPALALRPMLNAGPRRRLEE